MLGNREALPNACSSAPRSRSFYNLVVSPSAAT